MVSGANLPSPTLAFNVLEIYFALLFLINGVMMTPAGLSLPDSLEQRLELIDSLPALIWLSTADGRRVYLNSAWLQFTGRRLEQELGDGWQDAVHPDDRVEILATLHRAFAGRAACTTEYRLRRGSGDYVWLACHSMPLFAADGVLLGYCGAALETSRHAVGPATARRRRILAAAAHDLLQPLLAADLILGRLLAFPLEGDERILVDRLQIALTGMRTIAADLSHLDGGSAIAPPRQECALNELVVQVAAVYEPVALAKGLRLAVYAQRLLGRTDASLLERAVRNLVDNGVKATTSGGVVVAVRPGSGVARIQVWDTGAGLGPERQSAILAAFARPEDLPDDLGLGLYTVRRLCALPGHRLVLRSQAGRGSLFEIQVPLVA